MTDAEDPESLEARRHAHMELEMRRRIDQLERDNRKLKRQTTGTLIVVALLLGLSAAIVVTAARRGLPGFVPDVVESREFILRDSDGRVRGAWGADREGAIRFVIQEPGTQTSVRLNLLSDGSAGLTFADSLGNARVILALLPDQTGSLVFADRRGFTRTVMTLNGNGSSSLVFADGGGTTRAGLGVDTRGRPLFSVGDEFVEVPDSAQ